ncbi:MAG: M24 family metallopeptidase [Gemmatimonadota bacterium]
MAVTDVTVSLTRDSLARIQRHLREAELDGWLLYDFRGINPIATGVLSLPALSRRFFVFLPADGDPVAVTHRIEQQPWRNWIGENRVYLTWQSLEEELRFVMRGVRRVAVEWSERDGVPYLDRLPAGIVELIRSTGVTIVSSGDLVSAFYSRWTDGGEASHHRAAAVVREVAHAAFSRIGEQLGGGGAVTEWAVREWITSRLVDSGLRVGSDAVVAVNANAANPHYAPGADEHSAITSGDVVLVDLWGKENPDAIYADQTWMGYVGREVPERVQTLWRVVRDGRNAAVDFIRTRTSAGEAVAGYEVDDVTRRLITERGFGDAFIHRTGHSIDRELHGSGPNVDNLETRDTRRLIPGIGFSIEPGIYLPGEVGLRSEIDVFMAPDGPVVTTPMPQQEMVLIR